MEAMGLKSPAPIQSRLKHLQEKGYITWQEGKARTMRIVDEVLEGVPIMGSVAAGGLIETYPDVSENLNICSNCKFHLPFYPNERLKNLFDQGKYEIVEYDLGQRDQLNFRDIKKYSDRLKSAKFKSNSEDAIILAKGKIYDSPIIVAAFDFRFMGGLSLIHI